MCGRRLAEKSFFTLMQHYRTRIISSYARPLRLSTMRQDRDMAAQRSLWRLMANKNAAEGQGAGEGGSRDPVGQSAARPIGRRPSKKLTR
jgi:hypothetical protein